MKTTIKINLSGQIFTLDEDAYQILKDYLDSISSRFRDTEEGLEIIEDIESRIAELFQEKISEKKQVITIDDVRAIVDVMGQPEEILDEEGSTEDQGSSTYTKGKKSRKFYRDPDNTAIGGVCSGLAAYFGIEIWLMRLLWVVFFFATGGGLMFILYIVLWIAVPKAYTAAEKLEMRGEKVTVSNIEKTVKEEYETVKENVKEGYQKVKDSNELKKTKSVLDEILFVFGKFFLILFKIILFIIGFSLIIAGVVTLSALSIGFFFSSTVFPMKFFGSDINSYAEIFGIFGDPTNLTFLSIALFFTIVIPLIALIYGGIKMMFRFKANDKMIGLTAFVLWIISLIFLISMAAVEGWHFNESGKASSTYELNAFPTDTLLISMNSDLEIEGFSDDWYSRYDDDWHIFSTDDKVYGKIDIDISHGDIVEWEMTVRKHSQGRNTQEATISADNLNYNWTQESSTILLEPFFSLDKPNRWRAPETRVTVYVPEGKYVRLDKNTRHFLNRVNSVDKILKRELAGEVWKMTEEGLVSINE
jgi:phage shock protein PspC (stress-responsive transcriptional regulator)